LSVWWLKLKLVPLNSGLADPDAKDNCLLALVRQLPIPNFDTTVFLLNHLVRSSVIWVLVFSAFVHCYLLFKSVILQKKLTHWKYLESTQFRPL